MKEQHPLVKAKSLHSLYPHGSGPRFKRLSSDLTSITPWQGSNQPMVGCQKLGGFGYQRPTPTP